MFYFKTSHIKFSLHYSLFIIHFIVSARKVLRPSKILKIFRVRLQDNMHEYLPGFDIIRITPKEAVLFESIGTDVGKIDNRSRSSFAVHSYTQPSGTRAKPKSGDIGMRGGRLSRASGTLGTQ